MQQLRMEIETCPCPVCRSDMAYIVPCASPLEVMVEMVVDGGVPATLTGNTGELLEVPVSAIEMIAPSDEEAPQKAAKKVRKSPPKRKVV